MSEYLFIFLAVLLGHLLFIPTTLNLNDVCNCNYDYSIIVA